MSDVGRRRERGRGHRKGKERSYLFVQPVKGGKVVHTNRESTRDVQHLYLAGDGIDRFSKEWTYEAKKTVVLSTFAGLEPEALRTSPRFFSACSCTPHTTSPNVSVPCYICKGRREREREGLQRTVCSSILSPTTVIVFGSSGIAPEV
jgi:hypothetical protein